jgi:trafficking protein particle complex subunit 13
MVSGIRIMAEIISPSNPSGTVLELQAAPADAESDSAGNKKFGSGDSIQKILRFNLQEEGEHTLAVTVTYTETTMTSAEGRASVAAGGRVRTFRKLYQFVAASLISVRTKAGDLADGRYALEAQLENLGGYGVILEVCCPVLSLNYVLMLDRVHA